MLSCLSIGGVVGDLGKLTVAEIAASVFFGGGPLQAAHSVNRGRVVARCHFILMVQFLLLDGLSLFDRKGSSVVQTIQ